MGSYLSHTLALYLEAAPWLLLGLLAAGLIKSWMGEGLLARWLQGDGLRPVFKAALIGMPLPLCSCGVLPAALGLRRAGARPGPTASFMIATPETGVDSIAVSYALLGPVMAIARPLAALFSAVFTGLLVTLAPTHTPISGSTSSCSSSCCGSSCSSDTPAPPPSLWQRGRNGVRYAFTDILEDIAGWLLLGLLLAGLIATLVSPQALAAWGSGPLAMLVMLLVGIPMYICATASTPLAAVLLVAGVSPGTVLVFLLAGPATNIATIGVLRKEMGGAVATTYLLAMAVASILMGLTLDAMVGWWGIDIAVQAATAGEWMPPWLAWGSALLLALLALRLLMRRLAKSGQPASGA